MRQGLALLAAALAVCGCGRTPVKAYDGPSRPQSELAVMQGGGSGDEMSPLDVVEFGAVDGRPLNGTPYLVSVLPGPHTFGVKQTLRIGTAKRVQYCAFSLETAPGCRYTPAPPTLPPDALKAGGAGGWEWSVELPVGIACGGGSAFTLRTPARCGAAARLMEERNPR